MPDARTATARDFEAAAHAHARAFWFWIVIAAVAGRFGGWWAAALPLALTLLSIVKSIGGGRAAQQLRQGTFPIPNPNNGAPDGDASGRGSP